jgi:hypothetical protein
VVVGDQQPNLANRLRCASFCRDHLALE